MARGKSADPSVAWRNWYGLTRWQKRKRHQLRLAPYCKLCTERGVLRAAEVVDHVERHGGDWNRFWLTPLQSLCKSCHDSSKRFIEKYGYDCQAIGPDGWPTDPRHPANR